MRVFAVMLILCLALLGCSMDSIDYTEYELNEGSFGADTIAKIENESGIDLPDGVQGLNFYHIPPIDPIVFAKLKIPSETSKVMEIQITSLTYSAHSFPKNFANDKCQWWPSNPKNVVVAKEAFNNGYYIEAYLVKEKEHLILYMKYFTI